MFLWSWMPPSRYLVEVKSLEYADFCLAKLTISSNSDGISATFLLFFKILISSSALEQFSLVKKLTAVPDFPARPVLPTRCTYSSMLPGKSKFMTIVTSSTSMPLAAKSVATRIRVFPFLKAFKVASLSCWFRSPCRASAQFSFVFIRAASSSAERLDFTNIIIFWESLLKDFK